MDADRFLAWCSLEFYNLILPDQFLNGLFAAGFDGTGTNLLQPTLLLVGKKFLNRILQGIRCKFTAVNHESYGSLLNFFLYRNFLLSPV